MRRYAVSVCAFICLSLYGTSVLAGGSPEEYAASMARKNAMRARHIVARSRAEVQKQDKASLKLAMANYKTNLAAEKKAYNKSKAVQKRAGQYRETQLLASNRANRKSMAVHKSMMYDQDVKTKRYTKQQGKDANASMEASIGKWDYLYKLPAWPYYAQFAKKKDALNFYGQYKSATKAYSSSDKTQDLSKLFLREETITLKDMLLVSKLLKDGKVNPGTQNVALEDWYLYYLADETISFDASFQEFRASFDYARTFRKDITFGLQVPVASRIHKLRMKTDVSATNQAKIDGDSAFPSKYSNSFNALVNDIFAEKRLAVHRKNTVDGLGDIATFLNVNIKSKHVENMLVGARMKFATSRDRDNGKIWDAELGNGGFSEFSGYTSMVYSKKKYFNPHLFVEGVFPLAAYVDRRVPRRRVYGSSSFSTGGTSLIGATSITGLDGIALEDQVRFKSNTAFDASDSDIARLATETNRIKIHKGPELKFMVGNVFEKFITKRGFLDIYYDLRAKGRDYVGSKVDRDTYDPTSLTTNTFQVAHKIGTNLSNQIDENFRIELGGLYTFAGRNVPELWEVVGSLKWEF